MSVQNRQILWPLAMVVALLASIFSPRPDHPGMWLQALFEWLHVPVFGLISIALLLLTPKHWLHWQRYLIAFSGALFLGVVTEAIQIPMQRDASWEDILADGAGAASFLLAAFAVSRRLLVSAILMACSITLLTFTAWPVISTTIAVYHRNVQFPVILGGDISQARPFFTERNVLLTTQLDSVSGRSYTRVEVNDQGRPALEIRELVKDWSGFRHLRLEIEVEGKQDLDLTLRVNDKLHRRGDQPHNDRFNTVMRLKPGFNTVVIPLEDIKNAPRGRTMDMSDLEAIVIFAGKDSARQTFRLYEIRLG